MGYKDDNDSLWLKIGGVPIMRVLHPYCPVELIFLKIASYKKG